MGKNFFKKLRRVEKKKVERGKKNAIKFVWIANK
jgi:hypothetical protein